ncbi:hypothetical protein CEXT_116541 [Caerostris extrusa]|uniref:Uncharacterized protein n=1 Tax=Caerostris extrusa TaxID=172846 RepID=A0AAV4W177_CAEEX|nr:hypothetical protein CEXT_116541 [Caerostris extrusa]
MNSILKDSFPLYSMKKRGWGVSGFKKGRTTTKDDEPRAGGLVEVTIFEIIKKTHKIILEDSRLKLTRLSETFKITKENLGNILHDILGMEKL